MVLIVIGASITGFFTSELTQRFYKTEVEEKLKNTAILLQHSISEEIDSGMQIDYNRIARTYAEVLKQSAPAGNGSDSINTRITFIDFGGNVIGESQTDYHTMENHLNRKEVREAIQGKIGEDIRPSQTLKMDFLYVAVPLKNARLVVRVSVPLIQLNKIYETIWWYTIISILAGLLLTALLALKFSSSITSPVKELISVSREISRGNYAKRVELKSTDELGQLADTFNEMALTLEKTVADLIDKNVKVDSIINSMTAGVVAVDRKYRIMLINAIACEIFGIKNKADTIETNIMECIRNHQINNFLSETIEKDISLIHEIVVGAPEDRVLRVQTSPIKPKDGRSSNSGGIIFIQDVTNIKKLEQIRTEFVSNVTHELKTPLTSIRGFIETLRAGAINDRHVAENFLEIIDIEAERLYMLINDILQLSEIETKQKDTNISTHGLKSVIEETVSILQGVADKKNIRLSCEGDESIQIIANRDRIKQMLINLIDNGIKYNVENGSVHIKAFRVEGKVVLSVKDTGIGIAKEHLSRIFERFYRVDKGRSRSMGGTGLGLSIVKHIVNLYSGDIKVASEPGKGTEFIISLPV